jgi:hypothetical protein
VYIIQKNDEVGVMLVELRVEPRVGYSTHFFVSTSPS